MFPLIILMLRRQGFLLKINMEKHTQEAKYKGKNKGRNGIASGFGYATKLRKSFESCKLFRGAAQLYATPPALNWNGLCIYIYAHNI